MEVVDVADVQVRTSDFRVVADVTTAPDLTKLSRSWSEHDTLTLPLESVFFAVTFAAFLVARVVRALFRKCVRGHVRPRAACAHSVVENSTCTSRSDSTKSTELWFDVQRHSGSDVEGSSAVELLGMECLCSIHKSSEVVLQTVVSRHGGGTYELIGKSRFQLE